MFKLPLLILNKDCAPTATLLSPTEYNGVNPSKELAPNAVLLLPVVLLHKEPAPIAVFCLPSVLKYNELEPTEVLQLASVVVLYAENAPKALLFAPVLLFKLPIP